LKDYSDDTKDWQYKRRHTVLGKWFQIKQEGWKHHLEECEAQREFESNVQGHDASTTDRVGA
jgi:hypothetical protein